MTVPNGAPLAVRQGINNALGALQSLHSGPSAPSDPVAFQYWADTTTGKIKVRNAANNAWVEVYELWSDPVPISKGGHGATTLSGAKTALEIVSYAAQVLTSEQQTQARDNIGLGTAATSNTGTSGATIPLLNVVNQWTGVQQFRGAGSTAAGWDTWKTDFNNASGVVNTAPYFRSQLNSSEEAFFGCRNQVGSYTAGLIATRLGSTWANYRFQTSGIALAENGSWQNSSDADVKDLDGPISDPIAKLFELSGETWTRKDNGTRGIGLVAQDVQRIFPDQVVHSGVVAKNPQGNILTENMLAIDTAGVGVAVLVEALKAAIRRIEALEAQTSA